MTDKYDDAAREWLERYQFDIAEAVQLYRPQRTDDLAALLRATAEKAQDTLDAESVYESGPYQQVVRMSEEATARAEAAEKALEEAKDKIEALREMKESETAEACRYADQSAALSDQQRKASEAKLAEATEVAWGIIANAGGGDWTKETLEWQKAAATWRDTYWHGMQPIAQSVPPDAAQELDYVLDSPNFVPKAMKDLAARGYKRINMPGTVPGCSQPDAAEPEICQSRLGPGPVYIYCAAEKGHAGPHVDARRPPLQWNDLAAQEPQPEAPEPVGGGDYTGASARPEAPVLKLGHLFSSRSWNRLQCFDCGQPESAH